MKRYSFIFIASFFFVLLLGCGNLVKQPETIEVPTGNQSNGIILVEKLTADWCGPCASAAASFKSLFDNYDSTQVILLRYGIWGDHFETSISSDTRAFYTARETYYETEFVPTVIINGTKTAWGSINQNALNTSLQETPSYTLTLTKENDSVTVNVTGNFTTAENNLRLYTVLIEKEHLYSNAPGTNGQKQFDGSVLALLGQNTLIPLSDSDTISVSYSFPTTLPTIKGRIPSSLALVSFVQNHNSKKILGAVYLEL